MDQFNFTSTRLQVYIYTIVTFVFVTLVIYVLARFSPNQWEEPPNCIKDPEEYTNQVSPTCRYSTLTRPVLLVDTVHKQGQSYS
jgi:hypothetical protein